MEKISIIAVDRFMIIIYNIVMQYIAGDEYMKNNQMILRGFLSDVFLI